MPGTYDAYMTSPVRHISQISRDKGGEEFIGNDRHTLAVQEPQSENQNTELYDAIAEKEQVRSWYTVKKLSSS